MSTHPQSIGPYEVLREIGRGGMGVVYLAHDSRLDRDVAIKSLPEHFAQDPDRLARFEREAKTLASLNHPNIAGILSIEEAEGAKYLILEHVDGQTLADRLDRGPLPVDEAIEICAQIAEGIEAAHDAGVIHRDLKPANVKIDSEGRAKVLDFGLARTEELSSSGSSMSQLQTLTTPHSPTSPGAILGTAPYMSPEQARGRRVDKRSDIWSFGVILYECLAGASPFIGETASDSIGAILHKDVDLSRIPTDTPRNVRRLIERCLSRDKAMRLRDIGDAKIELLQPASADTQDNLRKRGTSPLLLAAVVALTAIAAYASWTAWLSSTTPEASVQRYTIPIPAGLSLPQRFVPIFDISRDGQLIVFRANGDSDDGMLYLRRADQLEATPIPGTQGADGPTLSPDAKWIVFEQNGQVKKISTMGGPTITLVQEGNVVPQFSWGDDGTIVYPSWGESILKRVSENGGQATDIQASAGSNIQRPLRPQHIPGGGVLFTGHAGPNKYSILALASGMTEPKLIVEDATSGLLTQSGHLLFARANTLMVARFDPHNLELIGQPLPFFEELSMFSPSGTAFFDISENGTLLHLKGSAGITDSRLGHVRMDATIERMDVQSRAYHDVQLSPDQSRVLVRGAGENNDYESALWILDIDRDIMTNITTQEIGGHVLWSPDGQWVYYTPVSLNDEKRAIYRSRADGSGSPERIAKDGTSLLLESISSDGTRLYATRFPDQDTGDAADVVVIDLTDPAFPVTELFGGPGSQDSASISPDGNWIAYEDTASGSDNLYVVASDATGPRVQISRDGADEPRWSPDGTKL
ncbi:MAG: protein kinase domain-containing protein, partial [Planctomycetota bacterium]